MSRTEKLYARLARLEEEYLRLIREEFQNQSDGLSTPFLRHKCAGGPRWVPINRTVPDDPTTVRHIDKLERDIVAIRRGLNETIPGPAVAITREVLSKWDSLGVLQDKGEWIRFVRDALSKIDAVRKKSEPSA
jgi:hypothetical protein